MHQVAIGLTAGWWYKNSKVFSLIISAFRGLLYEIIQKAVEEVTERAIVPYVKEKIAESARL